MAKEFIETYYHGKGSLSGLFTYRCRICGHSLESDHFSYCPYCGGNLTTGKLAINLYAEGYRNGLSTRHILDEAGAAEEGDLDG